MPTPRLWPALLRREVDLSLGVVAVLCAAGILLAAHEVTGARPGGDLPRGLSTFLRRLDITLLYVLSFLSTLRIATRIDADQSSGWLAPACAAGRSRREYGPALAAAVFLSSAVIFTVGAISFALGVKVFGAAGDLLRALPRTLSGGLLVLACFSNYAAVLAMLLRRSHATVLTAVALILVPYALTLPYLRSGSGLPGWLYAWVASYPPPLSMPGEARSFLHAVAYVTAGMLLLALLSHRYAGRQS